MSKCKNSWLFDCFSALVIGSLCFHLIIGIQVIDPTNLLWLFTGSTDATTHFIGWAHFNADDWQWPLGRNPNYGLELSSSIIFSDSIPLFALIFKTLSPLFPDVFQYTGGWLLLCFVLQAYFVIRIVGLMEESISLKIFAAVLIIFSPPFLFRLSAHYALFGHWIILSAILIYFKDSKNILFRQLHWSILSIIATLVHSYFIPMVLIIWAADLFKRSFMIETFRKPQIPKIMAEIILIFIGIIGALWLAGFFPLEKSYLSGGYGIHRLNLLSLFNPEGLTSGNDIWSYLIPALPQGYGDYEGFNYLGLGSLILFFIGGFIVVTNSHPIPYIKIYPIILAALFLFLFSISNKIGLGSWTLEVWNPKLFLKLANILRSSGRFFWPVFYLILLGCIWLSVKKIGIKFTVPLLVSLVIVQMIDTHAGWSKYSNNFGQEARVIKSKYDNTNLDLLAKNYKKLRVLPLLNAAKDWDKRAYFALTHNMKTDSVYLARYNDLKNASIMKNIKNVIRSKKLDKESLYLLDKNFAELVYKNKNKNDELFFFEENIYIFAPDWLNKSKSGSVKFEKAQF